MSIGSVTLAFADPWPNPAGRTMNLEFKLPARAMVRAEVVDVEGRRVSLRENAAMDAGAHQLQWDVRDASGHKVTAGVYLVRISTGAEAAAHRVVVIE